MKERVLVCILAQTRAHQATWSGFNENVLRALGADLALCIGVDDRYDFSNPFWQNARYRWTTPEFADYADGFDQAQSWFARPGKGKPADWRQLLAIGDQWLGGIKGPGQHPGSGAIQIYYRWLLYRNLTERAIVQDYDRFIVTRSDFLWQIPHPPLRLLDPASLWMPDGERYGGLPDRHLVAAAADILPAINFMEEVVSSPKQLARSMRKSRDWNFERLTRRHFEQSGLVKKVRFFPYVMFTVRGIADTTRWAAGAFDETLGLYVKYASEREEAKRYDWIRSAEDWSRLAAKEPATFHGNLGPTPNRKLSRRAKRLRALKRIATFGIASS